MLNSLRYAGRSLRRSPGFAVVASLTLGIGLGLFATMYAVVDAVLYPQTAVVDADRLFGVSFRHVPAGVIPPADLYRLMRDELRIFRAVAPVGEDAGRVVGADLSEDMIAPRVGPSWFEITGVRPLLGRPFTSTDEDNVVLLSERLARAAFGKPRVGPDVTVQVKGKTYVVIGILPRGAGSEILLPLSPSIEGGGGADPTLSVLVRLGDAVTAAEAQAALRAFGQRLESHRTVREAPIELDLASVLPRAQEVRDLHKGMLGATLAVLLIACDNLAHLVLARGLARRKDAALRLAMGASPASVAMQSLLEVMLITMAGLGIGVLIAVWGSEILRTGAPREVGWLGFLEPQLSWRVFAAAAAAAVVSAAVFGLAPVLRVVRGISLDEPLKAGGGTVAGRVGQRFSPLVALEVMLALVVLVGSTLLMRTLQELRREDPQMGSRSLFRVRVREVPSGSPVTAGRQQLLAHVAAMPEVRQAAFAGVFFPDQSALMAEQTEALPRFMTTFRFPFVSPNYMQVLGLRVLAGRDFAPGDEAGPGVAIVDTIAARHLYPGEDPVGRMIRLGGASTNAPWIRIVGVVQSPFVLEASSRPAPPPAVFVLLAASNTQGLRLSGELLIRVRSSEPEPMAALHQRLRLLPDVTVGPFRPWDEARQKDLEARAYFTKVFSTLGFVALILAAVGLYATLAFTVSQRRREFAIRVALGASPVQLLRDVLRDGLLMLLAGISIGALLSLYATRFLDALLVTVMPWDVTALLVAEGLLLAAGVVAAVGPALRAARAQPVDTLRSL